METKGVGLVLDMLRIVMQKNEHSKHQYLANNRQKYLSEKNCRKICVVK